MSRLLVEFEAKVQSRLMSQLSRPVAIIAPHAGYQFLYQVAAEAYGRCAAQTPVLAAANIAAVTKGERRVVCCGAWAFYLTDAAILSQAEREMILRIARRGTEMFLKADPPPKNMLNSFSILIHRFMSSIASFTI